MIDRPVAGSDAEPTSNVVPGEGGAAGRGAELRRPVPGRDLRGCARRGVGFLRTLVGAGRTENRGNPVRGLRKNRPRWRIYLKRQRKVSITSPIDAIGPRHLAGARKPQGTGADPRHELSRQHDPAPGRRPGRGALRGRGGGGGDLRSVIATGCRSRRQAGARSWANLSGGNQQKIVIGKWLSMRPEVADRGRAHPRHRRRQQGPRSTQPVLRDLAKTGVRRDRHLVGDAGGAACLRPDRGDAPHGRITREFTAEEVTEDSLIQAHLGHDGRRGLNAPACAVRPRERLADRTCVGPPSPSCTGARVVRDM